MKGVKVEFRFCLGEEVEHITGFRGLVTGRVQYYSGCVQYLVKPRCKEGEQGKMPDGEWLDEDQLTARGDGWVKAPQLSAGSAKPPGGPQGDAPPARGLRT